MSGGGGAGAPDDPAAPAVPGTPDDPAAPAVPGAPDVSVVIPTYDRLPLLREAVASVLAQTHADLELIVVDDGSSDGTAEWLATAADPRVRSLRLPHGANVAHVRNAGARAARGRYLCFLDSDDLWRPAKLEAQLRRLARAPGRWCYTRYDHVDERGVSAAPRGGRWRALEGDLALPMITTEASVALCTVMLERELFERLRGFDEDPALRLREDYELMLRLALAAPAVVEPAVLARIRIHEGRSTRGVTRSAALLANARAYARVAELTDDPPLRRAARRQRVRARLAALAARLRERLR